MAKNEAVQASNPMKDEMDQYRVKDAVRTMMDHQTICDDKPLYRQAKKHIRRLARSVARKGGR